MYDELLLQAQGSVLRDLDGDALLWYTIERRSEMLASGPLARTSAIAALAVEIAYDCALLKLCATEDIGASPADFSRPTEGRRRFESEIEESRHRPDHPRTRRRNGFQP